MIKNSIEEAADEIKQAIDRHAAMDPEFATKGDSRDFLEDIGSYCMMLVESLEQEMEDDAEWQRP